MGERTFVNSYVRPAAKPRPLYLGLDVPMLLVVAAILVIGLLAVYSSSWNYALHVDDPSPTYILVRQARWAFVGLIVAFVISYFDYHRLQKFALPIIILTVVALIAVLFFGNEEGPKRALFNGSVQPSELAKFGIVLYLSAWLNSKREVLKDITFGLLPLGAIIGFICFLIVIEPDYSAAMTVAALGILLFILANGDFRQIMVVFIIAAVSAILLISLTGRGQDRIEDYIKGLMNPPDASDHLKRALEAIVRGGVFGVGIGKGTTKFTGLPVPWTDSIFAVIAEETGILGALVVIALYILFLWRGITIAKRAPDLYGKLLAGGLTLWISLEAMINIGVMVNLIPFAGNALPLISYGGSNIVTTLAAIGIITNVSRFGVSGKEEEEGRAFSAVVDLRRRDRRRSVPRRRRSESTGE